MDQLPADNLPPELDELGLRMSTERPVASDRVLDRAMTRASAANAPRKSSLLWRSTAPRARKKSLALGAAGILAMGGMAGLTMGGATAFHEGYPHVAECAPGTQLVDLDVLIGSGQPILGVVVQIGEIVGVCIQINNP